jgi:hypothetical protein
MKPLSPKPGAGWVRVKDLVIPGRAEAEGWTHPGRGVLVLSSVGRSRKKNGKEYHLSVSFAEARCPDNEAMRALRAFGMTTSQEDNSGSRTLFVRHFWQAVKEDA